MFADPIKNLNAFGLRSGDVVADLGAGTGYYSIFAGALVPDGKVYAVEIDKHYLDTIRRKAQEAGLKNIEPVWGDIERVGGSKLGDSIADAAIVSNTLFQLKHKDAFISEIKRILKPGGKVLLVDWREGSILGNDLIFPKTEARKIFEKNGFALEEDIDTGNHHYGMILRKNRNED